MEPLAAALSAGGLLVDVLKNRQNLWKMVLSCRKLAFLSHGPSLRLLHLLALIC
jgi:hypothetical protein